MKRMLSLLLAAALLVGVLAACGAAPARDDGETTESAAEDPAPDAEEGTDPEEDAAKEDPAETDTAEEDSGNLADILQGVLDQADDTSVALTGGADIPADATAEEAEALESALSYLSFMAFSRQGLQEQLEFEGHSSEAAAYAVEHCGADWMEQAARSAGQYLNTMAFSKEGLPDQLEYEGFSAEEAAYGVEQAYGAAAVAPSDGGSGVSVGQANALASAQQYLDFMAFSYTGLIEQLEYEGYSAEEATYAADNCGADWNGQAAKSARQYLDMMSFSRQQLIDQLIYEGYTQEQAAYGVSQAGL